MKSTGVVARGIITPIFKQGDDIINMICDSVETATKRDKFELDDGDIVAVTEAVVGRTQGNYATLEQISKDVRIKFAENGSNCKDLGIVFPILSRNRFGNILAGIAGGCDKVYIQLSYPNDEVGNKIVDISGQRTGLHPHYGRYLRQFCPATGYRGNYCVIYLRFAKFLFQ